MITESPAVLMYAPRQEYIRRRLLIRVVGHRRQLHRARIVATVGVEPVAIQQPVGIEFRSLQEKA